MRCGSTDALDDDDDLRDGELGRRADDDMTKTCERRQALLLPGILQFVRRPESY